MKKQATAAWDVDPAGNWVTKKESLRDGSERTTLYRPHGRGTMASWWDTKIVETSGYRNRAFEMGTARFENMDEPFTAMLTQARSAQDRS